MFLQNASRTVGFCISGAHRVLGCRGTTGGVPMAWVGVGRHLSLGRLSFPSAPAAGLIYEQPCLDARLPERSRSGASRGLCCSFRCSVSNNGAGSICLRRRELLLARRAKTRRCLMCSLMQGVWSCLLGWLCVSHCPQPALTDAGAGDAYPRLEKKCHPCPAQDERAKRSPWHEPASPLRAGKELMAP